VINMMFNYEKFAEELRKPHWLLTSIVILLWVLLVMAFLGAPSGAVLVVWFCWVVYMAFTLIREQKKKNEDP
jgi:TRAP-type uncharacterized transport system fused permease subunit